MTQHHKLGRRDFLRIIGIGSVAGFTALKFGLNQAKAATVSETRVLMGTLVNLTLVSDDTQAASQAINSCFQQMSSLEAVMSRHQPHSQLSLLNSTGHLMNPAQSLLDVLRLAYQISIQSDGAFDITVKPVIDLYEQAKRTGTTPSPESIARTLDLVDYRAIQISDDQVMLNKPGMALTLDGIGKGYIVDEGVAVLRGLGFENVLVESGGDLLASGQRSTGDTWRIGVQSTRPESTDFIARIPVSNAALATSGDYMQPYSADYQQHHIIDPRTGYSNPDLSGVTVKAPGTALADALATAVMSLGLEAGRALIESQPDCEALLVTKARQTFATSGIM